MRLLLLLCALAALAAGCNPLDKVNRPLPEKFNLKAMDGTRMERAAFIGHPWVLAIWVPG
jgi:hypothetical protein